MKPADFKESNVTLVRPDALTDLECGSLHVYTDGKQCISLWKPSFKERISILVHGRVWLSIWGGKSQPPIWMDAQKTVFNTPTLLVRIAIAFVLTWNKIKSIFTKKA